MIYIPGTKILKTTVIEQSIQLLLESQIDFISLIVLWISIWLNIEIQGDDGICVYCLDSESNLGAEMQWGCECTDYVFLGAPYIRKLGYVVFEDSNY